MYDSGRSNRQFISFIFWRLVMTAVARKFMPERKHPCGVVCVSFCSERCFVCAVATSLPASVHMWIGKFPTWHQPRRHEGTNMSQNVPKHFTKKINSEIVVDCKNLVCFNDGNTRTPVAIAMTMKPYTAQKSVLEPVQITFLICVTFFRVVPPVVRNRRSEVCENSTRSVTNST